MKDILNDKSLKSMPYDLPEGYFEGLKKDLKECRKDRRSGLKRFTPYAAMAAMFALLVAAGGFFLERASEEEFSQEDHIAFSDEMTSIMYDEMEEQYADAMTEDDIIEYLIYTGTEIDELY